MKFLNYYLVLFYIILPFSSFALAPYPVVKEQLNNIKIKEFIEIPINKIEQKLDKQLKWHEKIALNSLKRKLKREAKNNPAILETQLNLEERKPLLYQFLMALLGLLILLVIVIIVIAIACSGNECFGP